MRKQPKPLPQTSEDELVEGKDFYFEKNRMVFTANFLLKRGTCCKSGCRHCPYGFGPGGLRKKLAAEQAAKRLS